MTLTIRQQREAVDMLQSETQGMLERIRELEEALKLERGKVDRLVLAFGNALGSILDDACGLIANRLGLAGQEILAEGRETSDAG